MQPAPGAIAPISSTGTPSRSKPQSMSSTAWKVKGHTTPASEAASASLFGLERRAASIAPRPVTYPRPCVASRSHAVAFPSRSPRISFDVDPFSGPSGLGMGCHDRRVAWITAEVSFGSSACHCRSFTAWYGDQCCASCSREGCLGVDHDVGAHRRSSAAAGSPRRRRRPTPPRSPSRRPPRSRRTPSSAAVSRRKSKSWAEAEREQQQQIVPG